MSHLVEGSDFVVWPRAVWDLFSRWYGGGPGFPRSRAEGSREALELYPLFLRVCGCDDRTGAPSGAAPCGNQNIQDTFNFIESEWVCRQSLSKLRDLDQRGTVVQKSAESTSI